MPIQHTWTMSRRSLPRIVQLGTIGQDIIQNAASQHTRANVSTTVSRQPSEDPTKPTAAKPANPFELGSRRADFKKAEALRPKFNPNLPLTVTQTPDPDWVYGKGVNDKSGQQHEHIEIDPYADDRAMISNYKLLVSGIPRPISFISTVSKQGHRNLSPMSYFQVVDHDPPIFVIGFSARASRPKDTKVNLSETGECVISVVTEHMIEAVNATSIDIPYGTSEWELSGLRSAPSTTVKPERVQDAVFSIEGRLLEMKELDYGGKHAKEGKPSGALAIVEATRFWIRHDALSKGKDEIDLAIMKPLVQLGGISYGRVKDTFELPRPKVQEELDDESNGLKEILDSQSNQSNR